MITAKLYERHQFHMERARFWRKRIDELHPSAHLEQLREDADAEHKKKFHRMFKRRLHNLWFAIYIAITFAGVALTLNFWITLHIAIALAIVIIALIVVILRKLWTV